MSTLLNVLQTVHRYQTKDLLQQLGVTEEEYQQIVSGELQMSLQQITALTELIDISKAHSGIGPVVVINNYNLGLKSRAINYPNSYTENEHIVKPQNHENTKTQTTEQQKAEGDSVLPN